VTLKTEQLHQENVVFGPSDKLQTSIMNQALLASLKGSEFSPASELTRSGKDMRKKQTP
jgi:hypothetical protein